MSQSKGTKTTKNAFLSWIIQSRMPPRTFLRTNLIKAFRTTTRRRIRTQQMYLSSSLKINEFMIFTYLQMILHWKSELARTPNLHKKRLCLLDINDKVSYKSCLKFAYSLCNSRVILIPNWSVWMRHIRNALSFLLEFIDKLKQVLFQSHQIILYILPYSRCYDR